MKNKKEYAESVECWEAGLTPGQILVHVTLRNGDLGGEHLRATPVGNNQARIDDIPVDAVHVGKNDIVKVSASTDPLDHDYLRTIKRGSYPGCVSYAKLW